MINSVDHLRVMTVSFGYLQVPPRGWRLVSMDSVTVGIWYCKRVRMASLGGRWCVCTDVW